MATATSERAWLEGMAELTMAFPYPLLVSKAAAARSAVYRKRLGWLTDAQWRRVVDEAIAHEPGNAFPAISKLLEYADAVRSAAPALPPHRRTDAELEHARAAARAGLELVQAALKGRLGDVDVTGAVRSMEGNANGHKGAKTD